MYKSDHVLSGDSGFSASPSTRYIYITVVDRVQSLLKPMEALMRLVWLCIEKCFND